MRHKLSIGIGILALALGSVAYQPSLAQGTKCSIFSACDSIAELQKTTASQAAEIANLKKQLVDLNVVVAKLNTSAGNTDKGLKDVKDLLDSGFRIKNVSADPSCVQPTGPGLPLIGVECKKGVEQQRWSLIKP